MKRWTLLAMAAESIRRNAMRTLLTMLGIVIGVAAVIVMVAVGNGARQQIEASINGLGTNVIMVMPTSTDAPSKNPFQSPRPSGGDKGG